MIRDERVYRSKRRTKLMGQPVAEDQDEATALLPTRHPMLRDAAVILAIVSTVCYFAFSQGVAGFLGFVLKIVTRLVHASN
jgi:hypothetical protein